MSEPLDYESWRKTYAAASISPERLAELKAFHPDVDLHGEIELSLSSEYERYVTNFWRTNNG